MGGRRGGGPHPGPPDHGADPALPACATAVVVVLQSPDPVRFVPLLFGSTVLLVLTGYAGSRIRRNAPRYPAYWW